MPIELRVLGEVGVRIGAHTVDIGHARQRCVLLSLLVDANRVVPIDQLVDRVWADRPPQRVRGALYNYVSRIRQIFAGCDAITISRQSAGYLLAVDESAVDLHLFNRLRMRARTADDAGAAALLTRALRLWRGEAFASLDTPWVNAVRDTLNNQRLATELDHHDIELRRGRHRMILPELTARATARPLDERLAGQLMLALYRCGRQADALAHYRRTRVRLADELGIDPGSDMRALHQRILAADPALGGDAESIRMAAPAAGDGNPATVLLVDDHPLLRYGLRVLLESEPWVGRVLEAETAQAGGRLGAAERPGVAVVDLGLPDQDGVRLVRELRRTIPACAVLVFTVTRDASTVRDCLAAGAVGYVLKETPPRAVVTAIRAALDGGMVLGPQVRAALAPAVRDGEHPAASAM